MPGFSTSVGHNVDKAFLRLIESILMVYETDYDMLNYLIYLGLKHRIIPTFALRRMVSASAFCISSLRRIESGGAVTAIHAGHSTHNLT